MTDFIPGTEFLIKQNRISFSFGTDAIVLTDFAKKSENIVDLGCGSGILFLRMLGLSKASRALGIEIEEDMANLSRENIILNGLGDRAKIINGDYMHIDDFMEKGIFDMVIANPPYFKNSLKGKNSSSRHEINMDFKGLTRAADYLLKDMGYFVFSHTPSRIPELFKTLSLYKLEPKRMCLVEPQNKSAEIVLIEARKNAKEGLIMEKTIIL